MSMTKTCNDPKMRSRCLDRVCPTKGELCCIHCNLNEGCPKVCPQAASYVDLYGDKVEEEETKWKSNSNPGGTGSWLRPDGRHH